MSNAAINAVFENSRATGAARLVLLTIADRADKSSFRAWCGAEDIAKRANIGVKNVPRITKKLQKLGELRVQLRAGPKCSNVYEITLPDPLKVKGSQDKIDPLKVSLDPFMVSKRPLQGEGQTSKNPKNQREDAEIPLDDLVKHFDRLFPHLRVQLSLSKMVFEEGWAPTIANAQRWLSIERGCRRKKPKHKITAPEARRAPPEPPVTDDQLAGALVPGTPEAKAAWDEAKKQLFKPVVNNR